MTTGEIYPSIKVAQETLGLFKISACCRGERKSCGKTASGEKMVTAPTCGACGILPAVLYYYQQSIENSLSGQINKAWSNKLWYLQNNKLLYY